MGFHPEPCLTRIFPALMTPSSCSRKSMHQTPTVVKTRFKRLTLNLQSRYLGKKHQEEARQIVWDARERGARRRALRVSYQLTAVSAERLLILAHTRSKPNSRQYNHKEALNGKRGERIKGRGQRKKALQTAGLVKVDSGLTERRNKTRRARENPQVVRPGGTPRSE